MNDWVAGRGAHSHDPGFGLGLEGTLKWVLLAVTTAVLFIGSYFIGFLIGSGTEPESLEGPPGATATPAPEGRVLLTVLISGAGSGRVRIQPRSVSCSDTCEREFAAGTRVTLTAKPVKGSRFEGWDDTCEGDEETRCSFVLDREREVSATFEGTPTPSQCEDGRDNDGDRFIDRADPGCRANRTEAPDNTPEPGTDCQDGRDNDSDGLVDEAQDPGCARDDTEIDGSSSPVPPPPVVTASPAIRADWPSRVTEAGSARAKRRSPRRADSAKISIRVASAGITRAAPSSAKPRAAAEITTSLAEGVPVAVRRTCSKVSPPATSRSAVRRPSMTGRR